MARTFRGGIHVASLKARTRALVLRTAPLPDLVILHMLQHVGAPCKPLVKRGDTVKTGQPVGAPQGFVSAPVHASVTGKVIKVDVFPHPLTGKPSPAVAVQRTDDDLWFEGTNIHRDPAKLDDAAVRDIILQAGIVGLGGAAFPTHVKLSPPADVKIDAVFLNAVECEPYLACDERLLIERTAEVLAGFRLIQRLLGGARGFIGIEADKAEAIAAVRQAIGQDANLTVVPLKVKYPQGAESTLIKACLGREVPWRGGLPLHVGSVVHNVGTALAIYEAVRRGMPLIRRALTLAGDGLQQGGNVLARIGTPIRDLLVDAGVNDRAVKLIMGGPMMGVAQWTPEAPVVKGTSGVLLLRDTAKLMSRACIRCGRCVLACPWQLTPAEFSRAVEVENYDLAREYDVLECKECGCCAYVCPSKRPIVQQAKMAKAELYRRDVEERARQKTKEAQLAGAAEG